MKINQYNDNEGKFSETLKALKNLPKVDAPDNFEFNLMVKINNGEFDSDTEIKRSSKLLWIFAPAGLIVTTVILFVTFSQGNLDKQMSPLQNNGSIYAGKTGELADKEKNSPQNLHSETPRKAAPNKTATPVQDQIYAEPNLIAQDYYANPFVKDKSFNLDELLKGNKVGGGGNLLTAKDAHGLGLPDDLFVKEEKPQKSLKEKKALQDSLNKLADSLKLKKNIKR